MRVWRISTETDEVLADDLSGMDAERTGGRWNRPGRPVLYAADTPSLACLETLVHLEVSSPPLNQYLVAVDIPDSVWRERELHTIDSVPIGWQACPPGRASLDFGDAWLESQRSAVLVVPSAIVPEACVVLINPRHSDAAGVSGAKIRPWMYDPRLLACGQGGKD